MTRLLLTVLLFCFATATQAKTACGFVTVKGGDLWDPYTGDPAQEEQGLYSVFATDTSTLSVIRKAARLVQQKITPVRIKNRHYVGFYIHRPTAI